MKLPQDIIFYQIGHRIKAEYIYKTADLRIGRPVFYEEKMAPLHCAVIIKPKMLADLADGNSRPVANNLYICPGSPNRDISIPDCSIIGVNPEISFLSLFNLLQEIYNRFDRWDETLKSVYQNGGRYQNLINCTEPVMFDPISLVDDSFHYVAYCRRSLKKGLVDKYVDSRGNIPMELVNEMLVRNAYSEQCKKTETFQFSMGDDHFIYNNLFYRDKFVGRLCIHIEKKDEATTLYYKNILQHLSRATINLYRIHVSFNQSENSRNGLRLFLLDSLNKKGGSNEKWGKMIIENGWHQKDRYVLIQFRPNPRYDKNIYADYLSTELERRWQGCVCFEYNNRLMLLVNENQFYSCEDNLSFRQALAYFLRESLLVAGISRTIGTLKDIYPAYKQTEAAIEIGVLEAPTRWLLDFDVYALLILLKKGESKFGSEYICSEKLLILKRQDQQKNTEYYKTLKTYFSCRFNAAAAAKKLFIHRSSFLNRMERIQETAQIDLDSADELLYLAISFKIMEKKYSNLSPALNAGKALDVSIIDDV